MIKFITQKNSQSYCEKKQNKYDLLGCTLQYCKTNDGYNF